jgi:hypothetical protein
VPAVERIGAGLEVHQEHPHRQVEDEGLVAPDERHEVPAPTQSL